MKALLALAVFAFVIGCGPNITKPDESLYPTSPLYPTQTGWEARFDGGCSDSDTIRFSDWIVRQSEPFMFVCGGDTIADHERDWAVVNVSAFCRDGDLVFTMDDTARFLDGYAMVISREILGR